MIELEFVGRIIFFMNANNAGRWLLNRDIIKYIAIVTMVLNHVASIFFESWNNMAYDIA